MRVPNSSQGVWGAGRWVLGAWCWVLGARFHVSIRDVCISGVMRWMHTAIFNGQEYDLGCPSFRYTA
jgi:hypothetical protein